MKNGSTLFLRAVVLLMAVCILSLCVLALPAGIMSDDTGYYRPLLIGLYVPAIPFFIAIYQTVKLLGLIDHNKAFTDKAVQILRTVKRCALTVAILFAAGLPYIYYVADRDDAPGVVAIAMVITFASMVIAVFAAVLQRLLRNAIAIKTENDLTV